MELDKGKNAVDQFYIPSELSVEAHPNSLQVGHERPKVMVQAHWHAQVEVNYIVSGTMRYRIGANLVTLSAGQMCVFWGGIAHQLLAVSPDGEYVCMHLPLMDFFRLRLAPELKNSLVKGSIFLSSMNDPADCWNFSRWAEYMRFGNPAMVENAVDELLLRIERSQFGDYELINQEARAGAQSDAIESSGQLHVARICNYIGANFREDIEIGDIARAVDLHPKYVMSIFKRWTGMTLNKYICLLRLSYSQALLVKDGISVIDIAMESGFGCLSAFNKAFAKLAGTSPSRFRRDAHVRLGPLAARELPMRHYREVVGKACFAAYAGYRDGNRRMKE